MKVILTHEITNLGEPGDIVDVKDGYGRNYLLPRNYAMRWSKGAAKQVESIRAAREARAVHDREEAEAMKAKLEESPIDLSVRAGQGGRLFGAVTVGDLAETFENYGARVDKRRINIGKPIKSLGAHDVEVIVHPEVRAHVKLNVIPAG